MAYGSQRIAIKTIIMKNRFELSEIEKQGLENLNKTSFFNRFERVVTNSDNLHGEDESDLMESMCEGNIFGFNLKVGRGKRERRIELKTHKKTREGKMAIIKDYERNEDIIMDAAIGLELPWLERWYSRKRGKVEAKLKFLNCPIEVLETQRLLSFDFLIFGWKKKRELDEELALLKFKRDKLSKELKRVTDNLYAVKKEIKRRTPELPDEVRWAYKYQSSYRKDYEPRLRKKSVEIPEDITMFEAYELTRDLGFDPELKSEGAYVYMETKSAKIEDCFDTIREVVLKNRELGLTENEDSNYEEEDSSVTYSNFSGKYPSLSDQDKNYSGNFFSGGAKKNLEWYKNEFLHLGEEGEFIETSQGRSFTNQVHDELNRL